MRIRFTETVRYETEGPGKGPSFQEGSSHDLRDDLAQRWLNRGVAEVDTGKQPVPSKPPVEEPPVEEAQPEEPVAAEPAAEEQPPVEPASEAPAPETPRRRKPRRTRRR